ncbi:MAG: NAD(P)H-hydrate epimerase [Phycisphaerales bacterium]|nr:NAD(P)H-hydrate epimerase [Phycisphaerales bacterium]
MPNPHDKTHDARDDTARHGPTDARVVQAELLLVFSREAIRSVDHDAIHKYGIPGIVLMENASRCMGEEALDLLEHIEHPTVLICCGPGNNGGDGFALARQLHNQDIAVHILLTHPVQRYTGDALTNLRIAEAMALSMTILDEDDPHATLGQMPVADLIVDALLGTGLDRPIKGRIADVVVWINQQREMHGDDGRLTVLAADIPTGLDCDTGKPLGDTVIADVTVTFVGLKLGFCGLEAQPFLGDVCVCDIGSPVELLARYGNPHDPYNPHDPHDPHHPYDLENPDTPQPRPGDQAR